MPEAPIGPLLDCDDLPMCPECFAILDDDGTCPDAADHGADLLALWSERQDDDD